MTVYLGKNPVGVGRIVEKKVAKEKYGLTVDSFLGDVDADGNYVTPSEPFEVNLAGVKSVPDYGFAYKFMLNEKLIKLIANDVTSVGSGAFLYACSAEEFSNVENKNAEIEVSFDNLEIVDKAEAFKNMLYLRIGSKIKISFKKLKKIAAAQAFSSFCGLADANFDEIFPSLEEISGNSCLTNCSALMTDDVRTFSKVKKITGGATKSYRTFDAIYSRNTVWNFPSATEFTGYIWNGGTSYPGEIHFSAANQAAIEACEGYDYKWGFAGATIFFDL